MKNGKLQAAILGCGNIAHSHAEAILHNSDLIDLYALCDILPERALDYQKQYGGARTYTDYLEMLDDPEIDMISICTPSGFHAEHAIQCAAHGKNVLCEKPLDIHPEKLDAMIAAFEGTALKAGAVFQYRTYPGIRKAKALLESGDLGRVLVANAFYKMYRGPDYYKSAGWRGTWAIDGGGSTMNQGIHIMDILCYLTGGASSILATAPTLAREIEVEDISCAVLRFCCGAVGTYQATTLANPPVAIEAELLCEKGRIVFRDPDVFLYTPENPTGTMLGETVGGATGADNPLAVNGSGHAFLIRNLAQSIKGEAEVFVPFSKGRHAVDVILALYASSRTGKEITII